MTPSVSLVGVLHGSAARFERAHVELPRKLARAMQAAGVRRLVHVRARSAPAPMGRPTISAARPPARRYCAKPASS